MTNNNDGAKIINDILIKRGVKLEYLLDEGHVIVDGVYPGVQKPVATRVVACKIGGGSLVHTNVKLFP